MKQRFEVISQLSNFDILPKDLIDKLKIGPIQITSLPKIAKNYLRFKNALPSVKFHFAVKANPRPEVLATLARLGCSFDVASYSEVEQLKVIGVHGRDLLYSNPNRSEATAGGVFSSHIVARAVEYIEIRPFTNTTNSDLGMASLLADNSRANPNICILISLFRIHSTCIFTVGYN